MQIIRHGNKNLNSLFTDMDKLYTLLSEKYSPRTLVPLSVHSSLKYIVELFIQNGWQGQIEYNEKPLTTVEKVGDSNDTIIVCISGGKDSIAVVKHYLDLGYKVHLYHMRHINFALSDEYKAVEELAKYWNLPLYIDTIKLSGHNDYIEHPMKNIIIANGALQYGIRHNITTNIAFGNYRTSSLRDDNFEYCGGDDVEMWEAYEYAIQQIIPGFKINIVLDNVADTLNTVCKDKKLLDMSISCMGRANLRQHKHDWVKTKYGIELPKHRCGQCYKCCMEYVYMTDHNLQEYNEEYYKYCLNKLKQNVEVEDGTEYSEEYVWNHYFFYPIERSRYYGQLRTT